MFESSTMNSRIGLTFITFLVCYSDFDPLEIRYQNEPESKESFKPFKPKKSKMRAGRKDGREPRQARARPARAPRPGACERTPFCHDRYGRAEHDAYVLDVGALRQVRCALPELAPLQRPPT